MKLNEVVQSNYHVNIKSWVIKAKTLSVEQIKHVLHDESERDPEWFITKRGSRLRQLASEIITLALVEVSDERWSESDFEGHTHSDLISQAIGDIVSAVTPFYHQIRTQLLAHKVEQEKARTNLNKEETNHVEQIKTH